MKSAPGVSKFKVRYVFRRGTRKGKVRTYWYYKVRISIDGRQHFLGDFKTRREAVAAYDAYKAKHEARAMSNIDASERQAA